MVKSSAMKILHPLDGIDLAFAYERLRSANIEILGHARHYINVVQNTEVAIPDYKEQKAVGKALNDLDSLIALHQCKRRQYTTSKTFIWEQRKFSVLYKPVSEKNDLTFGRGEIISVANMHYNPAAYVTNDSYLLTYNVMRLGDIAFEGNRNKRYAHGRFVENTIGDGIVSHVFRVFRPRVSYDLNYWKYAINNEGIMKDVLSRSTKASTMMHELVSSDFLDEETTVPCLGEQRLVGALFSSLDSLITLHQ